MDMGIPVCTTLSIPITVKFPATLKRWKTSYGEGTCTRQILDENRHNTVYFPNIMIKGPIQQLRVFIPLGRRQNA